LNIKAYDLKSLLRVRTRVLRFPLSIVTGTACTAWNLFFIGFEILLTDIF